MANRGDIIEPVDPDALYHGTSIGRWEKAMTQGAIKPSEIGDHKISLTTNLAAAQYFGQLAACTDHAEKNEANEVVILVFSKSALEGSGIKLEPFNDDVWDELGEDECAWEREVACWEQPIPVSHVARVEMCEPRNPEPRILRPLSA